MKQSLPHFHKLSSVLYNLTDTDKKKQNMMLLLTPPKPHSLYYIFPFFQRGRVGDLNHNKQAIGQL